LPVSYERGPIPNSPTAPRRILKRRLDRLEHLREHALDARAVTPVASHPHRRVRHERDAVRVALARGQRDERGRHVRERVQRREHPFRDQSALGLARSSTFPPRGGRGGALSPGEQLEVPRGRRADAPADEPVRAQEHDDVAQVGAHVRVHGGGGAEARERADGLFFSRRPRSALRPVLRKGGAGGRTDCGISGPLPEGARSPSR
jgi:hypothetical protein